jgi:hypothetical protein
MNLCIHDHVSWQVGKQVMGAGRGGKLGNCLHLF